ncbi:MULTISPECIES: restriction endonuclease subunit S [Acinetobacter calcoaceticus/baumannii complex]|nr:MULTISPECIES: restriction endonuclease subunit S [Acinetobacter calcoaceticus/baumannii complex]AVI34167.1 type I restriction modification DNA specificity domain protein [Acinetobacter baumannii]AVI38682.1 type I restriction modification DNA specificity domain protein [Acinetobacter baumannii]EHU1237931.1 restriction endonuclease subunit S [Acinetobacter baumannii]EHU1451154.1 restriction endonuclease subunit S [Acinetobacter baumannii]EHU1568839.1 restriction endonuclease subunit S [Acinet
MVQFKSSAGNSNIFIVNRSELKGRWEPLFYSEKYQQVIDKIHSSPWIVKTVKQLAKRIADGPFGSDLKVDEYQVSGIPLLRVSNIRTGEIDGKLVYISVEKNEKLKRSKVYPYDVVLTKAGAILGYSAVFPPHLGEGNITSHLVTISCSEEINPYYLSLFFKSEMGQSQIYQWGNKSTRPELNTGEVKKILVPVPPLNIQKEIVEKSTNALEIRNIKLAKAKEKLASIDAYLLDTLGIHLPKEDYSFPNRIFLRNFSEIVGGEWDPISISREKFKIEGGIYPNKKLSEISSIQKGQSITSTDVISGNYPVIAGGKTSPYAHNQYNYKDETITVSASGAYSGYVWYHDYPIFASDCCVIKVKNVHVLALYLAELLKVKQKEIYYLQKGAGQPHVYPSDLAKLKIAIPPLSIQEEIISHIQRIRDEAKKLEDEANLVLENVKQEIEKMILGEAV